MDSNTDAKTKKTAYISLKNKEYRKNNKELISCLQKKWYDDNKDKVKEKNKLFRQNNTDRIKCDTCDCMILKVNFKSHTNTKKHINNIKK